MEWIQVGCWHDYQVFTSISEKANSSCHTLWFGIRFFLHGSLIVIIWLSYAFLFLSPKNVFNNCNSFHSLVGGVVLFGRASELYNWQREESERKDGGLQRLIYISQLKHKCLAQPLTPSSQGGFGFTCHCQYFSLSWNKGVEKIVTWDFTTCGIYPWHLLVF